MSTLFIVPWPAAPTRSGTACASAPRHTSATRWLTSTLPAPTATGGRAATIVPGGATTRTGRSAPPLAGMVGSITERSANATARHGHRLDRVDVAGALRVGAGEVEGDGVARDRDVHDDARRPLLVSGGPERVDHVVEAPRAVGHVGERGAHAPLAVVR